MNFNGHCSSASRFPCIRMMRIKYGHRTSNCNLNLAPMVSIIIYEIYIQFQFATIANVVSILIVAIIHSTGNMSRSQHCLPSSALFFSMTSIRASLSYRPRPASMKCWWHLCLYPSEVCYLVCVFMQCIPMHCWPCASVARSRCMSALPVTFIRYISSTKYAPIIPSSLKIGLIQVQCRIVGEAMVSIHYYIVFNFFALNKKKKHLLSPMAK